MATMVCCSHCGFPLAIGYGSACIVFDKEKLEWVPAQTLSIELVTRYYRGRCPNCGAELVGRIVDRRMPIYGLFIYYVG